MYKPVAVFIFGLGSPPILLAYGAAITCMSVQDRTESERTWVCVCVCACKSRSMRSMYVCMYVCMYMAVFACI